MTNIIVNFEKRIGKIKQMHSIGQPPFAGGMYQFNFSPFQYIKDANIKYSRLHDTFGAFGSNRFVDIPNVFRNFDADENDPESYDFAFTDVLISEMLKYGINPIYRLGVTIENQANIKAYHIYPPKDYKKWARICEHIIRHYNEGWANGFYYNIEYWEIWNEPDNQNTGGRSMTWLGTSEQFYELYDVAAKHLKECFGNKIKVGGYAATDFSGLNYNPEKYRMNIPKREIDNSHFRLNHCMEFFFGFFEYIKANSTPLDFFSYHCYGELEKELAWADFVDRTLKEYGYDNTETMINEWNWPHDKTLNGSAYAAASAVTIMCEMQKKSTTIMCYYDAIIRASTYAGMFTPDSKPRPLYYGFKAFGDLYVLGNQTKCDVTGDGVYALAASNGKENAVIITNYTENENRITTNLDASFKVYLIDTENSYSPCELNPTDFTLKANQIAVIKNY